MTHAPNFNSSFPRFACVKIDSGSVIPVSLRHCRGTNKTTLADLSKALSKEFFMNPLDDKVNHVKRERFGYTVENWSDRIFRNVSHIKRCANRESKN